MGGWPTRAPIREVKQIFLDFWYSLEHIRVQMATGQYDSQSYVSSFSRVLSMDEILSPPRLMVKLFGSDLTPLSRSVRRSTTPPGWGPCSPSASPTTIWGR